MDSLDSSTLGEPASFFESEPDRGPGHGRLQRGTVLGRYVVTSRLGAGGMGVVYGAYDPELDRRVAVKLLHAGLRSSSAHARPRLLREAQALARLSHPNVVTVHDVGTFGEAVYLAMEFVDGQTLGEWLEHAPRSRAEILDVFVQAGRGLASAHDKGLVHRDFKPANVMVGTDGRVLVMDFGLARMTDRGPDTDEVEVDDALEPYSDALAVDLTQPGAMIGTPRYMSPEQFRGGTIDVRTDIFSYCTSLWEALYGELPYRSKTGKGLREAVLGGMLSAPRRDHDVPQWLRRALERGLAAEPDERWPSMQALLEELGRELDLRRRRRAWIIGLSVATPLVLGAVALWPSAPPESPAPCQGLGAHLDGVWDDGRREQARASMVGSGLGFADSSWDRVERLLSSYADAWVEHRTEACVATRVRGDQSDALMDRRVACLDDRLRHLDATVGELLHIDATAMESAVDAAASLPSLDACADAEGLLEAMPRPTAPEVVQRLVGAEEDLAQIDALTRLGRWADARALLPELGPRVSELDFAPLTVRHHRLSGLISRMTDDYAGAEKSLRSAYREALRTRQHEQAARAASMLLNLLGAAKWNAEAADAWVIHAEALAEAADSSEVTEHLLMTRGNVARAAGDYGTAKGFYQQVLELREARAGVDPLEVSEVRRRLASVASYTGNYARARDLLQQVLESEQQRLGPDHPRVAVALNLLGTVANYQLRHDESLELLQRAHEISVAAFGPRSRQVADSLNRLATVRAQAGQWSEAAELFEQSQDICVELFGEDSIEASTPMLNGAVVLKTMGKYEEARTLLERVLGITERMRGADSDDLLFPLINLAFLEVRLGRFERAFAYYERARTLVDALEQPNPPMALRVLSAGGAAAAGLGRWPTSIELLEHAQEVAATAEGVSASLASKVDYDLAKSLWEAAPGAGRDRARAVELATRALERLPETDEQDEQRDEIEQWLAAR
ncbi:MAG: serine/threonine-protein kinase [Myxococcota bacterium]